LYPYVNGIAGAPPGVRLLGRLILVGAAGDGPVLEELLSIMGHRCPLCIAPWGRMPNFGVGQGHPRRTDAVAAAARLAASGARSAAGAKKLLEACGIRRTEPALLRLTLPGGIWGGSNVCDHVVCDAVLYNTYIGTFALYVKGLEAVLVDQSDRGCSASVAVARLVASNRHYSAGNESWVSLRNFRRAKWSQMAMTVAALRAVALDLGDGGETQAVLLSIAEDLLEQAGILEAEMGDAALLARLAVLQARVAADTEAIFGPLDCGFETHVIAHTNYHVAEIAPTTGGVIHWDSGRSIETKMSPLKAAFEHFTGVWDVDKTLAVHHDTRGFAEQRLNPALDAAAAGFKAAACPGGAAVSSISAAAAFADSDSDSDAVSDDARPRVIGTYNRFPVAPQLDVRCTGALWSDMRCSDSGTGAPQVGGRLLQALEVAYNWLRDGDANLPRYSLDVLYWRRALRICRPPSL